MLQKIICFAFVFAICLNGYSQGVSTEQMPGSTLPSETTMNEIQNSTDPQKPSLRAKPPGGGPSIGEVITPLQTIDNVAIIGLLVTCAAYGFIRYRKARKRRKIFNKYFQ